MTNKEAIKVLESIIGYDYKDIIKANDLAIEALEEQTLNIAALKRDHPELFKPESDGGYLLEKES